jgi:hypothetical protein
MQEQVPVSQKRSVVSFDLGFIDAKMAVLAVINVIATLAVYVPFLSNFSEITRYWDGPLNMYVAKMFYFLPPTNPFNLPNYYFACNLALFPMLIRAFSFIGYDYSMLFVVIACSTLATLVFYRLLKDFGYSVNPFWASIVFVFFPARWLLYHSIGADEPLFILLVLSSIYCYKKDRYLFAFLIAGLASITKIFGILMFISYAILLVYEKKYRYLPYTLIIPAFLGANFLIYHFTFNNFFAYFQWNGGFMKTIPFMNVFSPESMGQTNNAELFLYMYVIYIVGALRLWKRPELCSFSLVFVLFMAFVEHPDISRYLLPAAPFALIVAFDDIICRKEFMLVFPLIVIFGYFYCWGIIPTNLMDPGAYSGLMSILHG